MLISPQDQMERVASLSFTSFFSASFTLQTLIFSIFCNVVLWGLAADEQMTDLKLKYWRDVHFQCK